MKDVSVTTLFVFLVCVGALGVTEKADAACWDCDTTVGCHGACKTETRNTWCSVDKICGPTACIYQNCRLFGASCQGTNDCGGSCAPNIEECGPANKASLIIPNGEMPADGSSWLEMRDSGLRLCTKAFEPAPDLPSSPVSDSVGS